MFFRAGVSNFQKALADGDTLNQKKVWIFQPSVGAGFKIGNVTIDYAFTNLANQSNPCTHMFFLYGWIYCQKIKMRNRKKGRCSGTSQSRKTKKAKRLLPQTMRKFLLILFLSFTALWVQAQPFNNEWIDYTKTYYKFKVGRTGLYRINQNSLPAALKNIPAEQFQLWRNGRRDSYLYKCSVRCTSC